MDDAEEIDILGDFDYKTSEMLPEEYSELPSNSVQLLPEFSQHPWLLEQGWSLEHCTDEKSRAAIEKMLLEEQSCIDGRISKSDSSVTIKSDAKTTKVNRKLVHHKKSSWTDEERALFFQGYALYGRRWSKIASLIPSKTHQQVKNYAMHHLKQKKTAEDLSEISAETKKQSSMSSGALGMVDISHITTETLDEQFIVKKNRCKNKNNSAAKPGNAKPLPNLELSEVVRIQKISDSNSDSEIDIEANSDDEDTSSRVLEEQGCLISLSSADDTNNKSAFSSTDQASDSSWCYVKKRNDIDKTSSDCRVRKDHILTDASFSHNVHNTSPAGDKRPVNVTDVSVVCGISEDDKMTDFCKNLAPKESSSSLEQVLNCDTPSNNCMDLYQDMTSIHSDDTHKTNIDNKSVLPGSLNEHMLTDTPSYVPDTEDTTDQEHMLTEGTDQEHVLTEGTDQEHMLTEGIDQEHMLTEGIDQEHTLTEGIDQEHTLTEGIDQEHTLTEGIDQEHTLTEGIDQEHTLTKGDTEEHSGEYAIMCSDGRTIYLPNPQYEVTIPSDHISDQEREFHAEFFSNKNNTKTPERYLKIRNHIIDCWRKCKPSYLKKTAVRNGLRNCGDVNCIGRIHSYLEQIGAINFGCEQAQYNHPSRHIQPRPARGTHDREMKEKLKTIRLESMRPRKRRVRDPSGDWIDQKDLEGKTIQHEGNEVIEQLPTKKLTSVQRYNPFKLVPCKKYTNQHQAPYGVVMSSAALVIMDIHAHLSKTEVIGLLGGHYNKNGDMLTIMTAEPCHSLSTGMQCEMDPVSQTQACERVQVKGQSVVGWYHSHPLFAAYPSVRDMETQADFQNWFASGGHAFVGVIISPYNQNHFSLFSDVRCLVVEKDDNGTNIPYEFGYEVDQKNINMDDIITVVKKLADLYARYPNRVNLSHQFKSGSLTCLDKMLHSIKRYFNKADCSEEEKNLVEELRQHIKSILK